MNITHQHIQDTAPHGCKFHLEDGDDFRVITMSHGWACRQAPAAVWEKEGRAVVRAKSKFDALAERLAEQGYDVRRREG